MPPSSTPSSERPPRGRLLIAALVLAAVAVGAALGLAELALRLAGFRFRAIPEVQFGWPQPQVIQNEFQPDPDLLWVTRDYRERLGRARRAAVVFLGDSCVEFSTYPRQVLDRLAARGLPASGEKLAVPGWSSEQGRAQMLRDIVGLHPRVITIEFGWNDHWDALGPPDDRTHPGRFTAWAANHLRVYQAYRKAALGIGAHRQPEAPRRVSLARYHDNLQTMVEAGRRAGARVVLITAPTSHEAGHEPEYLRARHLRQLTALVPLHREYVEETRRVARESGAALCDAAAAVEAQGATGRRLFRSDGIHFNEAGDSFMASLVADCVAAAR